MSIWSCCGYWMVSISSQVMLALLVAFELITLAHSGAKQMADMKSAKPFDGVD